MIHLPRKLLIALCRCAAAETTGRYPLHHLNLKEGPGGWRLEAADGKQLAVLRGPLEDLPEGNRLPFLLPAADALRVAQASKDGGVTLEAGDVSCVLSSGYCVMEATKGDGRFPDLNGVLPATPPVAEAHVNPELLISLLQLARELFGKEAARVTLKFHKIGVQTGPITLSCEHGGIYLDMLLMPLT